MPIELTSEQKSLLPDIFAALQGKEYVIPGLGDGLVKVYVRIHPWDAGYIFTNNAWHREYTVSCSQTFNTSLPYAITQPTSRVDAVLALVGAGLPINEAVETVLLAEKL